MASVLQVLLEPGVPDACAVPTVLLRRFRWRVDAHRLRTGLRDYAAGYTAFQFVWSLLQSVAMGGAFTGFSIAGDFENGFARRLMFAATNRRGIIIGYVLASIARAVLTGTLINTVALVIGMPIAGDYDLFGLIGLVLIVNAFTTLFGAGVARMMRTQQAGPVIWTPIFMILFLAPVFVPLHLLNGWLQASASVNPFTTILDSARGFLAGQPTNSLFAYAIGLALVLAFALWALYALRRAEKAG